jgi:hypothetical protein
MEIINQKTIQFFSQMLPRKQQRKSLPRDITTPIMIQLIARLVTLNWAPNLTAFPRGKYQRTTASQLLVNMTTQLQSQKLSGTLSLGLKFGAKSA